MRWQSGTRRSRPIRLGGSPFRRRIFRRTGVSRAPAHRTETPHKRRGSPQFPGGLIPECGAIPPFSWHGAAPCRHGILPFRPPIPDGNPLTPANLILHKILQQPRHHKHSFDLRHTIYPNLNERCPKINRTASPLPNSGDANISLGSQMNSEEADVPERQDCQMQADPRSYWRQRTTGGSMGH